MKLKLLVEHMRFRWLILSFFFGLLGVIAINFLTSPAYFTIEKSAPPYPSTAAIQPSLLPPLPGKVVSAERSIADALAQLPKGEVYHNVPEEMQVGVSETIEAGIASKVTEQIKKRLQQYSGHFFERFHKAFRAYGSRIELFFQS
ncbi:MAG: hypothetical protein LH660_03870 [Phormidesmis sp. CAN_BIN36]|nr:hypothetical protein [Phormidesmis sp. CAN_BIN36]